MAHSRPCTTSMQVPLACLRHVLRHCTALFLAQVCQHCLACVLPTPLTILARIGAILSVSIRAIGIRLTGVILGFALQPARLPLHSVPVVPTRESTPGLSRVSVTAGRVSAESRAPVKSQWSETASEGASFLFSLAVGFVIGVCTRETLCCTTPT